MYRLQDHLPLVLTLVLVTLVLSPTILPARGVIAYTPGVIGGQWALYKQLYSNCIPYNPALCGSASSSLDYGILEIVSVYNTQVTLNLVSVYSNGTGTHQGVLVDVDTGASNFTISPIPQPVPLNFFVTAKNLQAGNDLNRNTPLRFNSTISAIVAGMDRMVNVLNYTVSSSYTGFSTRFSTEFQFDQITGVFVKLSFSSLTIVSYQGNQQTSESDSAFGMVDNNIWSSPPSTSYPDFGISTTPPTVSTIQTSHANSTITITRMRAFNATVVLTAASSSSSLTCTLSQTRLVKGGTDKSILSCTGSPGSYTVTITGDSGYTTHPATATINIQNTPPAKAAPSTILDLLQTPAGYGGIAAAGIIIALLALLFTRRKRIPQAMTGPSNTPMPPPTTGPADPSTPPTQA